MDIVLRLLVAAFAVVAPGLLFLALWRGLLRLRDDALIERVFNENPVDPPLESGLARGMLSMHDRDSTRIDRDADAARCRECGRPNAAHATYCWHCVAKL